MPPRVKVLFSFGAPGRCDCLPQSREWNETRMMMTRHERFRSWPFLTLTGGLMLALALFALSACSRSGNESGLPHSSGVAGLAGDSAQGSGSTALPTAAGLPTATLTVEEDPPGVQLNVEIAANETDREEGLMYRQTLSDSDGMLFLFPAPTTLGFWMKNTYVPLDIAFLDDLGRVMQIVQGKPLDETVLVPSSAYTSVLEVAGGWFERHNLGVGATVHIPAGLPKAS